jgi:uncharacterized protein (TIGR02145 family)
MNMLILKKWLWTMEFLMVLAMFWACSDGDKSAGGTTEDAGVIADLNVAGLTQKGPFAKGSSVTVQGIDCQTMELTDEKFSGSVKSDKGDFEIKDVNLSSTCAVFEVTGTYFNELTGKKSADKLTLHALTDLKDRKNVNINLLTELEYERVMNLVMVEKMSFADAKEQAEKEVLAAFNVKSKDGEFAQFEDLSILEKGDDNAALLAVSVMVQSDLKVAKLAERVNDVAADIAKDGSWDDDKTKTEIAEWAATADKNGELANVNKNIEKWGGSSEVSSFETVVEKFAEAVITDTVPGTSSSSVTSAGSVTLNSSSSKNVLSSGSREESSDSKKVSSSSWTGKLTYGTGEYLNPNIKYDSIVDSRDGHVYRTVKIGNQVWMAENLNFETKNSHCLRDATTTCDELGRYYDWMTAMDVAGVYSPNGKDCGDNKRCLPTYPVRGICPEGFHLPDSTEWNILIAEAGGKSVASTKLKSKEGWYKSSDDKDYVAGSDDYGFSAAPGGGRNDANFDRQGHEAFFWSASENGFTTAKLMNLDNLDYLSSFLTGYAKEYFFNIRCVNDESYVPTPRPSIKYDSIVDSRDGQVYKTVKIGNLNWMVQNLNYEAKDSHCYDDSLKYCNVYGRLYSWASAIDSTKLANDKANPQDCGYGKTCKLPEVVQGVCPNGWHLPTSDEWSVLFTEVGGQGSAAKYLKSMMKWNGTDSVGFSVLPAGSSTQNGYRFSSEGRDAYFWTATEIYDGDDAYFVHMETSNSYVFLYSVEKTNGYSVRCVEDGGVIVSTVVDKGFDWELSRDSYLNPNINYDSIVDSRDGQVYKTVKIGDQIWMAQNLNYSDSVKTPSLKGSSWCRKIIYRNGAAIFLDDSKSCAVAGRLYTWAAAIDSVSLVNDPKNPLDCGMGKSCRFELPEPIRGICPEGFHLPTDDEWNVLFAKVGGNERTGKETAGKALKSQSGWKNSGYVGVGGNGTDAYGFSAMPVGGWEGLSFSDDDGVYAFFWSASEGGTDTAYRNRLGNDYDASALYAYSKANGYSVRCLKD